MIPVWFTLLLGTKNAEEFSFIYDRDYKIFIYGKLIKNEWVVTVHISALPYFACGFNNITKRNFSNHNEIIKYYVMDTINKLSTVSAKGTRELIEIIKYNLE